MLDIPLYPDSTRDSPWLGLKQVFEIKVFKWLESATFRLDFASILFYKRAMLPVLYVEYTEMVLDIPFYSVSNMGPHWLDPEKIFKMNVLSRLENAILRLVFANTRLVFLQL